MHERDNIQLIPAEEKKVPNKEKKRLIQVLNRIKDDLENEEKETIRDVYLSYTEKDFFANQDLKIETLSFKIKTSYYISLILITSINLVGSFIIASLKKSTWNLFFSSLKCLFKDFCDKEEFKAQTNFFEYYLDQLLREPMDLNLIMFWNFIGISLSNSIGFSLTSVIFLGLNILILILTYNISYSEYDKEHIVIVFSKLFYYFLIGYLWLFALEDQLY